MLWVVVLAFNCVGCYLVVAIDAVVNGVGVYVSCL